MTTAANYKCLMIIFILLLLTAKGKTKTKTDDTHTQFGVIVSQSVGWLVS